MSLERLSTGSLHPKPMSTWHQLHQIIGSWWRCCRDYTTVPLLAPNLVRIQGFVQIRQQQNYSRHKTFVLSNPYSSKQGVFVWTHGCLLLFIHCNLKTGLHQWNCATLAWEFLRACWSYKKWVTNLQLNPNHILVPAKEAQTLVCLRCKDFLLKGSHLGETHNRATVALNAS